MSNLKESLEEETENGDSNIQDTEASSDGASEILVEMSPFKNSKKKKKKKSCQGGRPHALGFFFNIIKTLAAT